jgi:ATP-dependent helicase HepA
MLDVGQFVRHRHNADLGAGVVERVSTGRVSVRFPEADTILDFTEDRAALVPVALEPGARVRLAGTGEIATLANALPDGGWRLGDGRTVWSDELWPVAETASPADRLAAGDMDHAEDLLNRLASLELTHLLRADRLGSFLGGRIRLYPHQLYAAERATATDPVRWLFADGVGLGKTVEACLVMQHLIHTERAERVVVVAPEALTVQWLGELWRKYHQIFVLIDDARVAEARSLQTADANVFEIHRRAIVSLERLVEDPTLGRQALAAGVDLLVVDEAHRLRRPPGHPGDPSYRAIEPLARGIRHALLLTATPMEADSHGFLRLLELLRPAAFDPTLGLEARLELREPLPPCVSATRAADLGDWPPRVARPQDLDAGAWEPMLRLERLLRGADTDTALDRRRVADRVARAVASAPALRAVLDHDTAVALAPALDAATAADPRERWLVEEATGWRLRREKVLLFVAHRETLERLQAVLERHAHVRPGIFHEDLPPRRRDLEAARFRQPDGPPLLIATECGGEGRNFEFCDRIVLYDLPWSPAVVEQRIGRLDRIGRDRPTEVVYFRPPAGVGRAVAALFEELGLFAHSIGDLGRELGRVHDAIRDRVAADAEPIAEDAFDSVLETSLAVRTRIQEAAYHELHREPYDAAMAESILARVPADLDERTRDVVLTGAGRLGFDIEESPAGTWLVELGIEALVESLPGVPDESRFLGTFDRETAVRDEGLDYFASGHPLVEGVLGELAEGERGRSAALAVYGTEDSFGVIAVFMTADGPMVEIVDATGRRRPDLQPTLLDREARRPPADRRAWAALPGWEAAIRRLVTLLPGDHGPPEAVAAFRIVPR